MNLLETYLRELRGIRSSGSAVKETSYYPALSNLLNKAGGALKPRVRCVINVRNQGAGIPDGGLFTPDQYGSPESGPALEQVPARGVIEAKGTREDVHKVARSEQVSRYLTRYGQVLVTNFRDFLLVGLGPDGKPVEREGYELAGDEGEFWAADPADLAAERGASFAEFLKRAMLYAAPLAEPKDVAFFLASYAREARARVEGGDLPTLEGVRGALEEALGLEFEGERGEHFFRSTLVQTLFYGVFAAWVLWSKQHPPTSPEKFDWRVAAWSLRVPVIRALFEQLVMPSRVSALGLAQMLDLTGEALNRVDRAAFFDNFDEDGAVQYFYEPFLEAFDPELRRQLGVWYTPPEVVRYMVERVDTALREELGLPDGLADESVYVLDPCTGTGSYPLEVLKRIARTLEEKGEDALAAHYLKKAATERVFGFEILPAPFVVAHLQLGLLLQNMGAPLSGEGGAGERAGIYLTNALTGWEPPKEPKQHLLFPELEQERDSAEEIKRDKPVLVVLGNPPYNAFAGVGGTGEERDLVEPYKEGLVSEWGIRKFNLDDLYVRFFRLAERRIAEMSGRGVVCYISNFSYLSDPSFVVMRKRFLAEFDELWFDSLNGDSRETGKRTPEGKPDPSVFSTRHNREGIRVGTAVGLMLRKEQRDKEPTVRLRQFWGASKRAELLESLKEPNLDAGYETVDPKESNRYSFRPSKTSAAYLSWPKLTELSAVAPSNGLMEKRGGALIDIDKDSLEARMRLYYDPAVDWETLQAMGTGLTKDAAGFEAKTVRSKVQATERYQPENLRRYTVRPFDQRWCYYSSVSPLWNRSRPSLWAQVWEGNGFLLSRVSATKTLEGSPFYFAKGLSDDHLLTPDASCFPIRLAPTMNQDGLFSDGGGASPTANLSEKARAYLKGLGIKDPDVSAETADLLWMHALAIGYSPAYLSENADGLRGDWPRIPLPDDREVLLASAELGRRVAALLDPEEPVSGVTSGPVRSELRSVGVVSREGGGALDPGAGDLAVRAGWGYRGKAGAVMPGRGRAAQRAYTVGERAAIEEGAAALGLSSGETFAVLGDTTCDVYLNDRAYWRNVPRGVWGYTIGGYQVMKKWLSYREEPVLGRSLTVDEAREVRDMARRITALRLLEPLLDANYAEIKNFSGFAPGGKTDVDLARGGENHIRER